MPPLTLISLPITLFLKNIEYRGYAATVPRRDSSFIQFNILNGIGIENGEKTEQVGGIENDGLVQ